ncbi:L-2-amino-thiazoline-4-carboxylic acid hydrolase [Streptomyces erythrochromogenes]|uniref:L-2-amino-thiazoline-4-carboxylic acid hydrolase n=1 Tax=Streptomyces erythrochromogenes TaxID=285574 RepID=UPI0036814984
MNAIDKAIAAEAHWLMGRVMPRRFLGEVRKHLHHVAPDREDELIDTIRARSKEIAAADEDLATDGPSKGALLIGAVVLAAFETLLPLFGGDRTRTIRYLQHAMTPVLRRPYDMAFSALNERDEPLDKIEKTCRVMVKLYPTRFEFDFRRPEPGLFEMNVRRCFWRDFFARHDATPVTTVMCAFDVNFMKAIDPAVSGLRAERTSLLSLGDSSCRFAVLETDDPLDGYGDALETRFGDGDGGEQGG